MQIGGDCLDVFADKTAWIVGEIEGREAAKGNVPPFNDLMIAAAAIGQGYGVLTGNLRRFRMIPGLKVVSTFPI